MSNKTIDSWHEFVRTKNVALLSKALADDVIFHSPVVHTPQLGKAITLKYLEVAHAVLCNDTFRYERELMDDNFAVLEFSVEIEGILVNGVDMISWDEDGMITDFKVMIRPLQAINIIHQEMAVRLQAASGTPPN